MSKIICPECGGPIYDYDPECRQCGFPLQEINTTSPNPQQNVYVDEGDNEAESILRNTLNWIKNLIMIASVLVGIVWAIMGIMQGVQMEDFLLPILSIIGGALCVFIGFAVAKLIWAVGMIFINISTNVRSIKKSLISNK